MTRRVVALSTLAATVAALAVFGDSVGAGGTPRLRVIISEKGTETRGDARGKFILEGQAGSDFGKTLLGAGPPMPAMRDGQQIYRVTGTNSLYGKKGRLDFSFVGVDMDVRRVHDDLVAEAGTWRITDGTGVYKRWRGGGRWAAVTAPTAHTSVGLSASNSYSVRWEGLVRR